MTDASTRKTFLSYRELIERAVERCREAENTLRAHVEEADERYAMTWATVADVEADLARSLADYAKDAPDEVLHTRLQYQPDTEGTEEVASNLSEAIEHLIAVNNAIADLFHHEAADTPLPTLQEALENVRENVDATNRKITQIRQSAHEL